MGGVYKVRERIHRVIADTRLLAIPTSWGRIADPNPNWDVLLRFASCCQVASLCTRHCSTFVALGIKTMMTWPRPLLPPAYTGSLLKVPTITCWQLSKRVALVIGLNPTPHGTSWRQPCSTLYSVPKEPSISWGCKTHSSPGKVPRVLSN